MMVTSLKNLIGKPVLYRGKPYTLWRIRKKLKSEDIVFGVTFRDYEYFADLTDEAGRRVLLDVPAEEVGHTNLKWDYINRKWIERTEQIALAE